MGKASRNASRIYILFACCASSVLASYWFSINLFLKIDTVLGFGANMVTVSSVLILGLTQRSSGKNRVTGFTFFTLL